MYLRLHPRTRKSSTFDGTRVKVTTHPGSKEAGPGKGCELRTHAAIGNFCTFERLYLIWGSSILLVSAVNT